jgi:hypothetical protein
MGQIMKAHRILIRKPLGKESVRVRKRWRIALNLTI